jgi:Calcium binding
MARAPKTPIDPVREHRITYEAVVDCYNGTERAMGWYYYLERALAFPFKARCQSIRSTSPLAIGEVVHVVSLADEEDCMSEVMV